MPKEGLSKKVVKMVVDNELSEYDVAELGERYDIIPKYVLYAFFVANGVRHADASNRIGVKDQHNTFIYRQKHPGVDLLINDFSRALLKDINGEALETMKKLLRHKSGTVQYNASKYILEKNLGLTEQNINIKTEKDSIDLLLSALKDEPKDDEL
jgi:hypothetical protein